MPIDFQVQTKEVDLKFIKIVRIENHYSMAKTARLLGLSGTEKYLRRENGEYNFKPEELSVLADVWNVPMEKFFTSNLRKKQENL